MRQRWLKYLLAAGAMFSLAFPVAPVQADVLYGHATSGEAHVMPVYIWRNSNSHPRAMVIAIHGVSMHGTIYDACARKLAEDGYFVAAPDLHGYGRWMNLNKPTVGDLQSDELELANLAATLRQRYPATPLFLAGESLGGTLALRVAAFHPELVDGLILSAPALNHHNHVRWKAVWDTAVSIACPSHLIDVSSYIKNYFSEDPQITSEHINDPLVRKRLSIGQLIATCRMIASTPACITSIPADMPVLIMQGQQDEMVKRGGVDILAHKLRTRHASVRVFPNRGHILLETAHLQDDTLNTVRDWLKDNCRLRTYEHAQVAHREPQMFPPSTSERD